LVRGVLADDGLVRTVGSGLLSCLVVCH